MAEVVGTVGAIVGLIECTISLGGTITRFTRAIGQVPSVINSVNTHISNWKLHLETLHALSQKPNSINQHLRSVLQNGGILGNAQDCLERLNNIITDAFPTGQRQTRVSEFWDQVAFHRKQDEVEGLLQQMDEYTRHLVMALNTNTAESVETLRHEIKDVAMAMTSAQEADAIFSWLAPDFNPRSTDPDTIHFEKSDQQEDGTCTWMTSSMLWRDWLQGGSPSVGGCRRFMWIHGLPGTGKTILASFLIDNLLDSLSRGQPGPGQSAKGFSYYYCHQEHDRDEAIPFLRWIVRDLCKQLSPPVSTISGERKDMDSPKTHSSRRPENPIPLQLEQMWQRRRLSINSLMKCLQAVAGQFHSLYNKRVYIIIDAIDESKAPRHKLLDVLTEIGTGAGFENVSLLMTSRPYEDIHGAIKDLPRIPLPTKALVIRPPTTQHLSLSPLTSGSCSTEPTLNVGHHTSPEWREPPELPRQSSPERNRFLGSGQYQGEGFDLPTTPRHLSFDNRPSHSEESGRSTPNFANFSGFEARDDSPSRKRSPPGNRDPANQPDHTSPRKRRLGDTFVSPCTSLSMANPHVEKAIALYVEQHLGTIKRFKNWPRPDFLGEMRRTLAAKAGGIFRTVACQLHMIEHLGLTEESKILDCINKMPDTIFETYERMLTVTLVPDGGDATREDREFARTALALMCSDTANIPDAGVLVAASRTTLPQLEAQYYTRDKLKKLLGCLVKVTPDPRPRTVFEREEEDLPSDPLFSVSHYTVKEFLYSEKAAMGPANYFALSTRTNQLLELKIAFDGLRHFDPSPRASYKPTRYEEYCLEMTDKALSTRPAIVKEDKKLQQAVFACLNFNAPHRAWVTTRANSAVVKQHFPRWNVLSPFERDCGPSCPETSILVNLLLLQWPELARIYLSNLSVRRKEAVWRDKFKLGVQHPKSLPQTTLVQMCVSRRRLDFLKIFTNHGVHFHDSRDDILFRAMNEPYDKDDADGGTTLALLKELLEHGADPNPEGFQVTPLQVATHYLDRKWVHQLLSSDADVHAIGNPKGVDPLPPSDDTRDRQWYRYEPLTICMRRGLGDKLTTGMQRGVKRVISRYLNNEIIELD